MTPRWIRDDRSLALSRFASGQRRSKIEPSRGTGTVTCSPERHPDEVFVKIQGRQQYMWRAVDEDGDVLDILVQSHQNRRAVVRFLRKLLKTQGRMREPVVV